MLSFVTIQIYGFLLYSDASVGKVVCAKISMVEVAGFLPVVAEGNLAKWLIISGYLGLLQLGAIAGLLHNVVCQNQDFQNFKIFRMWVKFWCFHGVTFSLIVISGFADFLPVVAGVVLGKWLIISGFFGLLLVVFFARCCCDRVLCSFLFRFKKKRTKRKGNFLSIAPLTKK
jgi:hypothetical protein